jgi:sigma-B regulation protein RsbU (phosphoserine phosphatase)
MEPNTELENKLITENQRLKIAVEELSILNDIATAITSTQSLEQIVELIVQKCIKHLSVEQGVVMILDEQDKQNPFRTMIRKQDSQLKVLPYRFDIQLTGWMLKNKKSLLINDLKSDNRFNYSIDNSIPIDTLLSVPLQLKGNMIGLITVFNKRSPEGFSANDQRLLSIIAAQSAQVIENARLIQKEQALLKIQEELRMAKDIQMNLLPKKIPVIDRYDIFAINESASEVGGDYYDFIKLSDSKIAFCLGDITGKGMPAAMLMANLQATLRSQAAIQKSIKDILRNCNIFLFHSTDSNKFATLFYAELDASQNLLTYCNAGHDSPLVVNEDKVTPLEKGGLLLGCFELAEYEQESKEIALNEIIMIYSDGVTEAMNENEEEFGEDRLKLIITSNLNLSSKQLAEKIIGEVKNHSVKVPQSDDISLMIIKRVG